MCWAGLAYKFGHLYVFCKDFKNSKIKFGSILIKYIILAIVILCVSAASFESCTFRKRIAKGRQLAEESVPFGIRIPKAEARILVVGDSTGVGTGADRPLDSIAGRIYQDFPFVEIINKSDDGAKIRDVLIQLNTAGDEKFDIVLVQVGGNDILRFTDLDRLKDLITIVLKAARQKSRNIIFISTGNVGLAPAFFPPISWLYTYRTRQVRAVFRKVSQKLHIEYVDLFKEKKDDPFLTGPEKFYAVDFLHPGSEGYRLWYEELKKQTSLISILENKLAEK